MTVKPGSRSGKYGSKGTQNAPKSFLAMLYNGTSKWTLHTLPGNDEESGPDIHLSIVQMGRSGSVDINLSDQTEAELTALQELLAEAFDWALPVAKARDEEANEQLNQDNDSFERIYRAVPTVVFRKRPDREHSQGIFQGPEAVPDPQRTEPSPDRSDGGTSPTVAEYHPYDPSAQDDPMQAYQPAVVPAVVGGARPPERVPPPAPQQGPTTPPTPPRV